MPAGWAALGAAVVAGGTAYMQSQSAEDAAAQQTDASGRAINAQQQQNALSRSDSAPFLKTGTAANSRLSSLLGLTRGPAVATKGPISRENFDSAAYLAANPDLAFNSRDAHFVQDPYSHYLEAGMKDGRQGYTLGDFQGSPQDSPLLRKFTNADLQSDPVYQSGLKFGLDRGTEGVNSRATASGMYDSGATLKALTQFGNDYGSTKANESYNRFTNDQSNTFNKLSGVSGTGQVANNQIAASGQNATNNIGASLEGAGNARAAGVVAGSNAWGNAGQGTVGAYNNYQSNKRLDALLAQNNNSYNYSSNGAYNPYYSGYSADGSSAYG